ncbi:hypothetical protein COLO4_12029 [Corchorus olitorius]|uniref:Uncharacterized protein n=1 Tax=Corchorus olitorius TaxID=93759 RepID=A0A1R3K2C6_9ROSI|nr:hypothetical protein COLO4_12029 [Corchorus olitorius]
MAPGLNASEASLFFQNYGLCLEPTIDYSLSRRKAPKPCIVAFA